MEDRDQDRPRRHSDTMRIDIRPEEIAAERKRKKIVVHRRKMGQRGRSVERDETADALGGPAFQKLLHNIYDAVVITDIDGHDLSANERAKVFFRCDDKYLRQRSMLDLISGADEDLIPTILKNLDQDRFTLIQADCIRADGSTFPSEISANRIDLGERECITFFIRDITRRKAREEQLRTGYFAIQNSGDGIMITDPELNLTYSNPTLKTMLGCARTEDLKGTRTYDFFVGDGIRTALQYLEENPYWDGELEIKGGEGERVFAHVSIVKNISTENMLTGYIFSLMDVTSEHEANRKLEIYAEELRRKNEEMSKDLSMARDIQRALLPREYPQFSIPGAGAGAHLEYGHIYIPSGEIGGDFFDVIPLDEHRLGLFIADVSGHGMRAALITATLRGMVEELASSYRQPAKFMHQINNAYTSIFRISHDFSFVTATYAVLDTRTGQLDFSIAGHPEPILLKAGKGARRVALDHQESTPAIGLWGAEEIDFSSFCLQMDPGDMLLLYTDGILEELNAQNEEYGAERLEQYIGDHCDEPIDNILDGAVADLRLHTGRRDFNDDVCMLAVAITHSSAASGR